MIQAIAVDDEFPALQIIDTFCARTEAVELQKIFNKPGEALQYVADNPVDLLFLDINMPSQSGIDLCRNLPKKTMIIFTTAYSSYAVEGFSLNAIDYLLKPFTFARFMQAVEKAEQHYKYQQISKEIEEENSIVVRADYSFVKIQLSHILYVESLGDYIRIHLQNQRPVITRITMKNITDMLPAKLFVRIHRSYIVALQQVSRVKNKTVIVNNIELPVSGSYESEFFNAFTNQ